MPRKRTTSADEPTADDGVMAGHGYYDHHSTTQREAASVGLDQLESAADVLALDASPLTIADLGCAQGHNSLSPIATVIAALRRRTSCDINVVHTDLPDNDWATFFDVVEHDPASYLVDHDADVHPLVVGRSFYRRLFAARAVSLMWTSSTLHWLSHAPGPITDHFFVQLSTDAEATEHYRNQAAADWNSFLTLRSLELAITGSVVFVDVLMGDDGLMGSEALFGALEASLHHAREADQVTADEYASMVYPTWFRSLAELRQPFAPTFSGPDGQVLDLVSLEPATLADPFWDTYQSSGDAAVYGQRQAGFLRGFLEPSFRAALRSRSPDDQGSVLGTVFADCASRIAADPEAMSPAYRLVAGRMQRPS